MKSFDFEKVKIDWFGHASFMISDGKTVVYIDNYILPQKVEKKADIIIHTHEHFDHCVDSKILEKDGTIYLGKCKHAKNEIGEKKKYKDVEVEFVHAYNIGKPFHPKGFGCGVIINFDSFKVYHAGDTDAIAEMKNIICDVALLPIGGTFTMNEKEAVEALKIIKTKRVIPMHYNYLPQTKADPLYFKKLVENEGLNVEVIY